MIYLDSCIIMYAVENTPLTQQTLEQLEVLNPPEIAISWLSEMECLIDPYRQNDTQRINAFQKFFQQCQCLSVTQPHFNEAAKLRAKYQLKTPDALHLAIAKQTGCTEF